MNEKLKNINHSKIIIKVCHVCYRLNESYKEPLKCQHCHKSFLPLNYFYKVHDQSIRHEELFAEGHELHEEDLVKGIYVLW
ncbi:hypothetical protein N9N67_03575 [Bacteriovoracaceae bacterium]|nr:hypothetical protein [Bacteriovoracaceae bacterium]